MSLNILDRRDAFTMHSSPFSSFTVETQAHMNLTVHYFRVNHSTQWGKGLFLSLFLIYYGFVVAVVAVCCVYLTHDERSLTFFLLSPNENAVHMEKARAHDRCEGVVLTQQAQTEHSGTCR